MKRILLAATLAIVAAPVFAADVGVSINIGEPGFYGQLDIGDAPRPEVIYQQPRIIERGPTQMAPAPIYLRVPPGYEKHWSKHCHQYNACGKPVYFVKDKWYNEVYAPHYREREKNRGERHDERRDDNRGEGHPSDHHDNDRDHN